MDNLEKDKFIIIGKDINNKTSIDMPKMTYFKGVMRNFKGNKLAIIGLIIIIFISTISIIGPYIRPFVQDGSNLLITNNPPSLSYWFGTDQIGRDLWTRIWKGTRNSLMIGFIVTSSNILLGLIYGSISGYIGGKADRILIGFVNILRRIPFLIKTILLILLLGDGIYNLMLAMSFSGWDSIALRVRNKIIKLKNTEYIMVAKTLGADTKRIILKHFAPNILVILIISFTFRLPVAIFGEIFLKFIGIGIPSSHTSLGSLISLSANIKMLHPYQMLFPLLIIIFLMLGLNMFAYGLRDLLGLKPKR